MNELSLMPRRKIMRVAAVAIPNRAGTFALTLREGCIAAIEPAPGNEARRVALPGLVNLHAHADRSFSVQSFRLRSLANALAAATKARDGFTSADVRARAGRFFERSIVHGVSRVRTHTDVDAIVELRSMQGLLAARDDVAGRLDVDIIAFATSRNDLAHPDGVRRLERAIELKPEFLGASLNSSADPERALNSLLDLAERNNLPAEAVIARGLRGRVTFSHLCALSTLEPAPARALIEKLARAQITVVALPETNLLLQDRADGTPRRRGVTLVHELLGAGVRVRLGTDNVRDWFYPFGDGDMLETALSAAIAAHLDDPPELIGAICDGRRSISEGEPADFVLIPASSFDDALARSPAGRIVFKDGRQVAGPGLD